LWLLPKRDHERLCSAEASKHLPFPVYVLAGCT
jgi:hypothetical protein